MPPGRCIPSSDYRSQVALLSLPSQLVSRRLQHRSAQTCRIQQIQSHRGERARKRPLELHRSDVFKQNSLTFGQYFYIFKHACFLEGSIETLKESRVNFVWFSKIQKLNLKKKRQRNHREESASSMPCLFTEKYNSCSRASGSWVDQK